MTLHLPSLIATSFLNKGGSLQILPTYLSFVTKNGVGSNVKNQKRFEWVAVSAAAAF